MFEAVLVANRGEIAMRIIRACRELGVRSVAVYSEADRDAPHVRLADEAYLLGGVAPADSYLNIQKILDVAREAGVQAVHPGYGFLAENAEFARAVAAAGLVFIGPPPEAIEVMGDKLSAREVAKRAGVPVVPGTDEPVADVDQAIEFGARHGYPVAVKAMYGGGGRGMKVVRDPEQMREALEAAQREAAASFGRGECYLERYLERPRHIEIQLLADADGTIVHLGDRDCSLQRRHQKLIEEAPAPGVSPDVRAAIAAAAVKVAREMGYVNAGTCEFLLDADGRTFYFLEMNTRLQVEHPVTELVTGIDLVHAQLRIAAGEGMGIRQDDVRLSGHAIEVRVNAEDPANGFVPTPGRIHKFTPPLGPGIRLDAGAESGYEVPPYYDSMIAKLVVWAADRDMARARMLRALQEFAIEGIPTTIPFHRYAIGHPQFAAAEHSTVSVERDWELAELAQCQPVDQTQDRNTMPTNPYSETQTVREVELTISGQPTYVTVYGTTRPDDRAAAIPRRQRERSRRGGDEQRDEPELRAPIQGTVVKFAVEEGATVSAGDVICVIEAMKMENYVHAHRDGTVTLGRAPGDAVERGATLAWIKD